MLTPSRPSSVPTVPTMPGWSTFSRTSSLPSAATSTSRPLIPTMRGWLFLPMSVPAAEKTAPSGADGLDLDQVGVVAVGGRLDDLDLDAQALEQDRGIDEIDLLAADPAEEPALDRAGDRIDVQVDDLAPIGDPQRGDLARGDLLDEGSQLGAQVEVGREDFRAAASIEGMLTALRMTPPLRTSAICSAISTPTASCASAVEAPRCGVRTTLGSLRSSLSAARGSSSYTSSPAAADLAGLEGGQQRRLLDDAAPGAVEDAHPLLASWRTPPRRSGNGCRPSGACGR